MSDFVAKKKFGQNFLTDKNLLASICADAKIEKDDEVLEIGAGMGALTRPLCERAKKVVAYEIDEDLKPILMSLGYPNLTLHFEDVLKKELDEIEKDFSGKYKLVANLPYYITSPIIFKFLRSQRLDSLTVMVQKEVGQRMCAKVGDENYGLLSVSCAYYGKAKILRNVPRRMFSPQPDVDSCIVCLALDKQNFDDELFFKVVKAAFGQRRKTLLNALHDGLEISKSDLQALNAKLERRAEELDTEQFKILAKKLEPLLRKGAK